MKKIMFLSLLCFCITGCTSNLEKEKYIYIQKNQIPYIVNDYNKLINYAEQDSSLKKRDIEPFKCRRDELISKIQQKEK